MSKKDTAAMLDKKMDPKLAHTIFVCSLVMVAAVLVHDGDHIRQAINWGYSIPIALWCLNLTVYVLPVLTIFSCKIRENVFISGLRHRRHFHSGLFPYPAPFRLGNRAVGRMELLLF